MGSNSHFHNLQKKWAKKHRDIQKKLWTNHGETLHWATSNLKQLTAGAMGGLMLISASPSQFLPPPLPVVATESAVTIPPDRPKDLVGLLSPYIPQEVRALEENEEKRLGEILSDHFGVHIAAELDGKRLNRSYGYIGAEQHLARYPGDKMESHFDSEEDARKYTSSGMAPGLGAWRYFAPSKEEMTEEDSMKEKYYIAVQTFLAPDYNKRFAEYRDFFKFRKMLVVNPQNGKGVVAVIGDAGPAVWTGKHLGGSPEVMKYLERVDGRQRGPVLYFFVDDPENKIPLGPIKI